MKTLEYIAVKNEEKETNTHDKEYKALKHIKERGMEVK